MQFSIVTALSLVAAAAAVPAHTTMNMMKLKEAIASNYTWAVIDWQAGCATDSDCSYSESAPRSLSTPLLIIRFILIVFFFFPNKKKKRKC